MPAAVSQIASLAGISSSGGRLVSSGAATISFNIGATTPNYPVQVQVFAQVDDQQLSWSTTFTPH